MIRLLSGILASTLLLIATPATAQQRPTAVDLETARLELYEGSEARTPHLTGPSNQYHPSKNPTNRFEVQVLSWTKMKQRLAGVKPVLAVEPIQRVTVDYVGGRREVVE